MMENRIDEFIKQKVSDTHIPPSPEAWSRLESQLPKKSYRGVYMRIAAAIALLISAGFAFWLLQQNPSDNSTLSQGNETILNIEKTDELPGIEPIRELPKDIFITESHIKTDESEGNKSSIRANPTENIHESKVQEDVVSPMIVEKSEIEVPVEPEKSEIEEKLPELNTGEQLALNETEASETETKRESLTIVYKPSRKVTAEYEEPDSEIEKAKKNVKEFIEEAKDKGDNTIEDLRAISNNVVALNVGRLKEKVFKNNKNEAKP